MQIINPMTIITVKRALVNWQKMQMPIMCVWTTYLIQVDNNGCTLVLHMLLHTEMLCITQVGVELT